MSEFVYLASQSPRRRQLLEQLGVRYELLLPDAGEDSEALEAVKPGEAPAAYVRRVTGLKLDAAVTRLARRGLPAAPVLCSDTTVALGRTIYGKPEDERDGNKKKTADAKADKGAKKGAGDAKKGAGDAKKSAGDAKKDAKADQGAKKDAGDAKVAKKDAKADQSANKGADDEKDEGDWLDFMLAVARPRRSA